MAKNTRKTDRSAVAGTDPAAAAAANADLRDEFVERSRQRTVERAEAETKQAEDEGRLPESMAVTNPAPATTMDSASGAFIEPEIRDAIPVDHPSVENNPRFGTSAVQNGADFNDPSRRDPADPKFAGQGLDLSVYGAGPAPK
jgi:hypothetical protein